MATHCVQTQASALGCIRVDLKTFTFGVRWACHPLLTCLKYKSTTDISIFLSMLWNAESWWVCMNNTPILLWVWWEFQLMIYPCKEVSNHFTGDIIQVSFLMLMSGIFCHLKWGGDRLPNHIDHPPFQNSDILILISLWCATDRPGQFISVFLHSQSAVTSCFYTENQLLFATSHVKYNFKKVSLTVKMVIWKC